MLHVLGRLVALEAGQAEMLGRICAGSTIAREELASAVAAAPAATPRRKPARRRDDKQGELLG